MKNIRVPLSAVLVCLFAALLVWRGATWPPAIGCVVSLAIHYARRLLPTEAKDTAKLELSDVWAKIGKIQDSVNHISLMVGLTGAKKEK